MGDLVGLAGPFDVGRLDGSFVAPRVRIWRQPNGDGPASPMTDFIFIGIQT